MKKVRLLLCLLAAVLITFMIPAGTYALSGITGSGTQADPYVIASPAQIWVLTDALSGDPTLAGAYIRLDCNVDMTGQSWPSAATFDGQLDGNTHTLTLDTPFLGTLAEGSKVKALELVVNGAQQAPLFCSVNNGIIECCSVTGAVDYSGSIGFFCTTNNGMIVNCRGLGSVRVSNEAAFVRSNTDIGSISNCYVAATFTDTDSGMYVTSNYGPILGYSSYGTMDHCYYDGDLFKGTSSDSSVKLTTAYMKSAEFADYLNEYNSSTGLAWVPVNDGYPHIEKFYEGTANLAGHTELQVLYHTDTLQITFDKSDPNSVIYYTLDGRDPRSSYTRYSDQQSPMTINGDIVVKAVAYKNGQYGTVKTQRVIQLKGAGTEANPYRIYTALELDAIRVKPDKWFTLESDITFSTLDFTSTGNFPNGWIPIPEFTGNLNGKGHAIRNIEGSSGGLIASNKGTVDSLRIIDHRLYRPGTCGAVANYNNGTVIRCYAKSAFSMNDKPADTDRCLEISIGGIVGNGNVSYSTNDGFVPVTSSERYNDLNAGGISGRGTCEYCINRGLIAVYPTALTEYVYLGGMSGRGSAHDSLHLGSMYSSASMDYDQYVSMMVGDSNAGLSGSFWNCAGIVSFENNATSGRTYQNNSGSTSVGYRSYILTNIAERLRCQESSYPDLDFTSVWMMSPEGPVPQGVMDADGHCFNAVSGSYAAPTCTEDGGITYVCSICGMRKTVALPKMDHMPLAAVYENEVAPTCMEDGHKDKVVYCASCSEELSRESLTTDPALGHNWNEPTFTWATDNRSVTASHTCSRDDTHIETETVNTISEVVTQPTCTAMGETTYTAVFENSAFEVQTKTLENVPALGHDWEEPLYVWTDDNSAVTAIRICSANTAHVETERVSATYTIVEEPTCTTVGTGNFTSAAFQNEAFQIQTKTDELPPIPHVLIHHDAKAATCTEAGWEAYDTCENCGYTTYVEILAKGHAWGEISYVWADDNSVVTATRICGNDDAHTETETVSANYEVTAEPSCAKAGEGTYTSAAFQNEAFQAQIKTVELPALPHEPIHHDAKTATCTEAGWDAYDTCANCDYTTYVEIPAKGHAWGEIAYVWPDDNSSVTATRTCGNDASHIETETVSTNYAITVIPSCTESGIGTYTSVAFQNEAFQIQIKNIIIGDPYGHNWDTASYVWADDNSTVTATRICRNDASHVETETVSTTCTVTVKPSCTEAGEGIYTSAAFENEAFQIQTKTANIAPSGHAWGEISYAWNDDNTAVTATRICGNDDSHIDTETVSANYTVTAEPSCTEAGIGTYTSAAFENEAFQVQTKTVELSILPHDLIHHEAKDATCTEVGWEAHDTCANCGYTTYVEIPAKGHAWGEISYAWNDGYTAVTGTRICGNDDSHVETETVSVNYAVTVTPSCTKTGIGTYTSAAFENGTFQVQTKIVELPILPHDLVHHDAKAATCAEVGWEAYDTCANCGYTTYVEIPKKSHPWRDIFYIWATDNSAVTAIRICGNDPSHVETEKVSVTYAVTAEPSCTEAGTGTYTSAVFKNEAFQVQTKTIEIAAIGHVYGEPVWLWAEDLSSAEIIFTCEHDETHIETIDAEVSSEVTLKPTAKEEGTRTYTATVTVEDTTYTDFRTASIPAKRKRTMKAPPASSDAPDRTVSIDVNQVGENTLIEITGNMTSDAPILVSTYDANGRFQGLTAADKEETIEAEKGASSIKVFWIDENAVPLCLDEMIPLTE